MPPLPAAPSTMRLDLNWLRGGTDTALNRFYLAYSGGPPSPADMVGFANDFMTAYAAHLAGVFASDLALSFVFAEDLASNTGATGISSHAAVAGTDAGTSGSWDDAVLMKHTIGRRYRGGKPRTYWPPMRNNRYASPTHWDLTQIAGFASDWDATQTAFLASTHGTTSLVDFVNVSYYSGHHLVAYPSGWSFERPTLRPFPVIDAVVGFVVEAEIASQRRRVRR